MHTVNLPAAGTYLGAKLVAAVVFAVPVSMSLMLLGTVVGKVVFELARWVGLFILTVLGVVPLGGVGVLVWHW
jgi:putative Mn2+ efflux pump MntP